jgi:hypothetical protein
MAVEGGHVGRGRGSGVRRKGSGVGQAFFYLV